MNIYKGTIVENSLSDKSILDKVKIKKKYQSGDWTLYDIGIEESQISELTLALADGPWYIHLWQLGSDDVIVIFKNKTFHIKHSDQSTWSDAVTYGKSIGIPADQLDFLIS